MLQADDEDGTGLCGSCRFGDRVASSRGSEFLRCLRSRTDPAYDRYPRLPRLRCEGYEPRANGAHRACQNGGGDGESS